MLLDRDRHRPAILVGVAEAVQRTYAGIADPGEDEPVGTAHADELVVDDVGRHPDEGEMSSPLANDLMSRREWNEMGEPLHGDRVTVAQGCFHGLGKTKETRHGDDTFQTPQRPQALLHCSEK